MDYVLILIDSPTTVRYYFKRIKLLSNTMCIKKAHIQCKN